MAKGEIIIRNVQEMTNNDIAAVLFRIADCVQYFDRVSNLHDCNDCAKGHPPNCEYLPRPGENTRINCPLWEGGD